MSRQRRAVGKLIYTNDQDLGLRTTYKQGRFFCDTVFFTPKSLI